ncbi:cancer-related regulator of actin dynamics isoform X1 [Suricata suricatta]|uniref:cancer-related regulator of actin dynamics isoform X1 n=3 Tax=Suricata suricatta TaxID=37032 RepID=UPI001155C09B|nr:cancer-related regulator of actin dynamics isoform X1 [Suricata suricatta]
MSFQEKKKGGKFQPFKKLFGKRKKKDTLLSQEASAGSKSHSARSISNGTFSSDEETLEDNLRSFNYSMGTRAFSHDSIFIPDGGAESEQTVQAMSQDNILGKVKTLQRQLSKNIKFGQPPPKAIPMKKADSGEASLEEDLFLTSPMEIVTQEDIILSDTENKPSDTPSSLSPLNPPRARSEMEEKVAPVKPSRPKRHFSSAGTIESVNLDAIPLAIARLDNSAAKHKLSVKPKNQRVSKKHRRLARDRPHEQGSLPGQLSLDQNGHPGEDKPIWHEEEPELLGSEEEKRSQEEYWLELEAKCKRQKAEAAERRRLEEQRLQALERRLWEENRRQEVLEEVGEDQEGEETELQLEAEKRQRQEERQTLEGRGGQVQEWREQEEGRHLEAQEQPRREQLEEQAVWSRREAKKRQEEQEERELKELRRQEELEEERRREAEEQWQREEEEQRQREEQLRLEEEQRRRCLEEQEQRRREEEAQREREEKRLQEEEQQEQEEKRREEEAAAERRAELGKREEVEAQRWQEAEAERQEAVSVQEERWQLLDIERSSRSPCQVGFTEKAGKREHLQPEKQREHSEESRISKKQSQEAEPSGEQQAKRGDFPGYGRRARQEKGQEANMQPPQKPEAKVEETLAAGEKEAAAPEKDKKVEELRWQEVDERQTTPRPYTFQVSSGGKQILFPKVNLSPVTPLKDAGPVSAPQEPKASRASPVPPALPSSLSVPHTAILVTGAQLCGPAVNLSQIKDTACKSLLGLSEEKKHVDAPALENPPRVSVDPRAGSGKARPSHESPSSVAALAEWASIRSRILKNAEIEQRFDRDLSQPGDEHTPRGRCDSRGNLRRTPPVNAKFSIMPAWQKFSDGGTETSKQNTEAESIRKRPVPGPSDGSAPQPLAADEPPKGAEKLEPADNTEGCKFAKDLPSFLVPSLPYPPQKAVAHAEPMIIVDSETISGIAKADPAMPGQEEKASPFGIKLRRTNYSLRFHCDQQTEQKKKKRHSSTGDNADGGPPVPASTKGEKETEGVALKHGLSLPPERKQALSTWKDSAERIHSSAAQPGPPPVAEHDKVVNKMPLAQKPALAPKPAGQTPPSSPLSKLSRPYLVELLGRRGGRPDPEPGEPCKVGPESRDSWPRSPPPPEKRKAHKRVEEDMVETERKPASPALSAAWPEKPSQIPEAGRKEKPVLQSRHSLDGSKLAEKVETAQPLWITLALQKQKGFREQQATREERKHAREAKQAEKLSRENVGGSPQPGSGSGSRAGSLHKPSPQPEEKQPEEKPPETAVSRLERREQLKKANTLPTSVTVEISDAAPPAPLVKEVTKRFSTPDAAPVSTEPAWLALAKRKAKAWSDCPQIIK